MRTILLVLLAIGAVTYGIFQRWAVADRDAAIVRFMTDLVEANADRQKLATEVAAVRQEAVVNQENVARLTAERDAARAKAKESGTAGTLPAAPEKAEGASPAEGFKAFAKMFETEEGKKMMKSQMRMVTQMQYGDLAKELGLAPDDAEQLMALLSDRQGELAAESFKFMSAENQDGAGLATKAEAVQKDYEQKLKGILGDERFGQFQEYEKTIGDRMMLTQFDHQFTAAGAPLAKPQRDQLLQIMGEERRKLPPQIFDTTGQNPGKGLAALQDDAAVERFIQQEGEYHQRVLAAAPKALNPDQVNALQKSFQQMAEMQKFGIKMNREMFKNVGSQPAAPAAPAEVK